jgi:hypothetical protein
LCNGPCHLALDTAQRAWSKTGDDDERTVTMTNQAQDTRTQKAAR